VAESARLLIGAVDGAPPNTRIQSTPLALPQERGAFEGWIQRDSLPDLSVRRG
jgi:hypothetical protein